MSVDDDEMQDPIDDTGRYTVGYRKPPKTSRFKKGVSGNASGRPRRQVQPRDVRKDLQEVYLREISVRDGDSNKKLAAVVVLYEKLVRTAINGDTKAMNLAVRLAEGLGVLHLKDEVGMDLSRLTPEERKICNAALALFSKAKVIKG